MCGIAGILGREDKPLVQSMMDRIAHRGPDGEGIFTDVGVTLGHRRLAILDVARGQQPMTSADGRFTIVYNGEVYNEGDLRRVLEAEGVSFRTTTDTEVVLEAYAHWGPEAVGRFEGMFAFAIWDSEDRSLFLARDPWGVKPLFYACTGDELVFASEQKALFAHPQIDPVPDLDRVKERAALEFLTGQGTLFAGVHQLPPGTWARLGPEEVAACHTAWQPYYQVPLEHFESIEEAARAIKDRFVRSVREQLHSDVPLGVILSGGLDSAAVATVHQRMLSDEPVHTFTIADSEAVEDFRLARRLAEELGTEHHEATFDLDTVLADLPRFAFHNENINYTEFFFLPLFEMMRKDVKVGLCGQGSDELWGGYDRYRDPLPLARERLARIRQAGPRHEEELATTVTMTHLTGSALAEWDQQGQLANFQLRLVDRNSMAHGLEVRVPYLSRPLHQASRAVPWGWKLHRGGAEGGDPVAAPAGEGARPTDATAELVEKWILRKAFEDLGIPDDLLWRPKVPAGRATSPGVMERFEAYAQKLVPRSAMARHPLAGTFRLPAEQLVYDLWHEVFVERGGDWAGVSLEMLA